MKAEKVRAINESRQKLAVVRPARVKTEYHSRIEWLPARDIDVKEGAQRPFDQNHAAALARDFDPDALGYPFVVAIETRNGVERYYAVDGQHRIAAVKLALGDDQQVQCEVVRGIDIPRAAELFLSRNRRRGVRPVDAFLVGVTAQRPDHLAITKILNDLGLRVTNGGTTEGTLSAVSSLLRIYRMEPEERRGTLLRKTLTLALESWGRGPESFNGDILSGLSLVLARHGDQMEADSLERKLRQHTGGALGLLGKARSFREAVGGNIAQCVARAIVAAYNSGRTRHKLPTWGEKAT